MGKLLAIIYSVAALTLAYQCFKAAVWVMHHQAVLA